MAFESFYGGRAGAAFVIVKSFDGIDIPQPGDGSGVTESTYTAGIYAVDENQAFIVTMDSDIGNTPLENTSGNYLIKKTSENYLNYSWQTHANNGEEFTAANGETYSFNTALAQGMIQYFSQGAYSSSEVNYGEYVLIDTMANMGQGSNPDNGKVFRRGMDITNEYAGGEYIGQIVGPQGETPELDFTTYTDLIANSEIYQSKEYTNENEGIVPGSYIANNIRRYNDNIKYAYTTIKDEFGNVEGCLIGLQLPTLVTEFEAYSVSPYGKIDGTVNLIAEDKNQYNEETGEWIHPFYQKWQLSIPRGIHGIDATNIEIISTYTMPAGFKSNDFKGAAIYIDSACSTAYKNSNDEEVFLETSYALIRSGDDNHIIYNIENDSYQVFYDNQYLYVKADECYMNIIRYKETNFNNTENGESTYIELGDYNNIQRITISEDGTLTAFYSAESQPQQLEQALRWIDIENTDGITIDDDGTITIYYNTLDEHGEHEYQTYPKLLDWITDISLNPNGQFIVVYNNDTKENYETTLSWINRVELAEDGTLSFTYNTGELAANYNKTIKYLDNVNLQSRSSEDAYEGTGDQKIHLVYNTGEDAAIGDPINYIIETCISSPSTEYPNAPYSHLLVYFSDPALRANYADKHVKYPSTKIYTEDSEGNKTYAVWSDWVDMGNVRGTAGGIHIIGNYSSASALTDSPEILMGSESNPNTEYAGWAATVTTANGYDIYFYDYNTENWYNIGSIDSSVIDPSAVIVKSAVAEETLEPATGSADSLNAGGFWLAAETAYYAN